MSDRGAFGAVSVQDEQVALWSAFAARVRLTFPFRVDVLVRPYAGGGHHPDQAEVGVELHVLDRDTREPITVYTRRPAAPWTSDEDALDMIFDLLDTALRHETYESVRLDDKLARELHTWKGH
jgi:hypothetical protein